ncbi:hypothetical protein [Thermococcus sp. MAR1]|uniref:hypothetical protein n=1 Tax=Thermococcus sp. MAR1 TaxID=1638263 RepID=UPI00143AFA17|nr:hypothetical protein [Thermococcus sp. MAR1]NJE11459.1 hypothetical protein [Thermococcus sp. MAR1]
MGRYNLYIPASTKYLLRRASKRFMTTQVELAKKIARGEITIDDITYWGLDLKDKERIRFLKETEEEFSFKAVFPVRTDNPKGIREYIKAVDAIVGDVVREFYNNHEDLVASLNYVSIAIHRIMREDGLTEWDKKHLAWHVEEIQRLLRGDGQ